LSFNFIGFSYPELSINRGVGEEKVLLLLGGASTTTCKTVLEKNILGEKMI
jgi:hypothetical protein